MKFPVQRFFVLALAALFFSSVKAESRPNIVFIISDDHGTDDVGAYGHPNIHTPALDALAADGVRFTKAYATAASCTPSRSTLQTGLHNHANGLYGLSHSVHHFRAHEPVLSLSAILADLGGYATARVGKFHVAPTSLFPFYHEIEAEPNHPVLMARATRDFIKTQAQIKRPFFL